MLHFLDILLSLTHFVIIGFNLFAWIFPATRKAHFICITLTGLSWFILGIWYGIGYCPITDWEWRVKEKLGEYNLPNSFVKYYADKLTGQNISPSLIDTITVICFLFTLIMSVYMNFLRRSKK
jgi:hypothetical protein